MTLEELQKQLQAQGGLGGTNTGGQPTPESAPEENTPALTPLQTRGAGQFLSVNDYLTKTGTDVLNMASRAATLDSQRRADTNAANAQSHYDLVGAYQDKTGNTPYGLGQGYVSPQLEKTEGYMFSNARDAVSKNATASANDTNEEYNKLVRKMQETGKANPASEYPDARSAVFNYNTKIQEIEKNADKFASQFGEKGSDTYNTMYAIKTQAEGLDALVTARDNAQKDVDADDEEKRLRQLFHDETTDLETLKTWEAALIDAQERDTLNNYAPAGSADTMNWDNSFNQNQTVNGQAVPTYDPVTNYNWFSGNDNDEINRLRREAQRKGLVWGSPEFEEYVRQHLNNG